MKKHDKKIFPLGILYIDMYIHIYVLVEIYSRPHCMIYYYELHSCFCYNLTGSKFVMLYLCVNDNF